MGADYYACTVIGVRLNENQAYQNRVVKAFQHEHPTNWKVDPVTGRKLWLEEKTVVLPFPNWDTLSHEDKLKISYMESDQDYRSEVYVGICRQVDGQSNALLTPFSSFNIENLILILKKNLEPLNLWNEHNFGIWTFGYVSY